MTAGRPASDVALHGTAWTTSTLADAAANSRSPSAESGA
jgi:hypothetical protein